MNLKKALEKLDRELDSIPDLSIATLRQVLRCILEAFAEPEEGEEKRLAELQREWTKKIDETLKRLRCPLCDLKIPTRLDQPLKFGEGDLVRKNRERAIFQKYDSTEPQEEWCCVLIATFGGHLSDRHWRIRDIELIEPGYCLHRLKSLRNKLTES